MCNLFSTSPTNIDISDLLDLGGVIEAVAAKVAADWKKGDRIAAFVHGGNDTHPEDGTRTCTLRMKRNAYAIVRMLCRVLLSEGGCRPES